MELVKGYMDIAIYRYDFYLLQHNAEWKEPCGTKKR